MTLYRLFGLTIDSEIALPTVPRGTGEPDAVVRWGELALDGPPGGPIALPGGIGFRIEGLGSFAVTNGRRIVIDADRRQDERNVRLYLLGTALGLLLQQRGLIPLHANTIAIGQRVVAMTGRSGSGKSTLALAASDRGYAVLGDDVAVFRMEQGRALVSRGLPRLRLWGDTLEARGRDRADLEPAYLDTEEWDKFDLPFAPPAEEPRALAAIFALSDGARLSIEPASGAAAAELLMANVYRGDWVGDAAGRRAIFDWAVRLSNLVPVYRFSRPRDLQRIDAGLDAVWDLLETMPVT